MDRPTPRSPRVVQRRSLVPLMGIVVALGLADSMTGSYLVLFATKAGLAPLQVGTLTSAIALSGIAASAFFGRRFDRRPSRAFVIVVGIGGAIGYVLMPQASQFAVLLILGLTLVGIVGAGYPQAFALAAAVHSPESDGQRATPLLRSGWSLAWAVGPMVGSGLLMLYGYAGLFRASAIALLLAAAVVIFIPSPRRARQNRTVGNESPDVPGPGRKVIMYISAGIMLVHCAMFGGSIALPFLVTQDLRRPQTDVGFLFSGCAVVEIAAALALVWLLPRIRLSVLILSAFALFAGYFIVTLLAGTTTVLLLAQFARGSAITVLGTAGIQYFQSLTTGPKGAMTALFSNAGSTGSLIAGFVLGGLLQWIGTAGALTCCLILTVAGGLMFWTGHRLRIKEGLEASTAATIPSHRHVTRARA